MSQSIPFHHHYHCLPMLVVLPCSLPTPAVSHPLLQKWGGANYARQAPTFSLIQHWWQDHTHDKEQGARWRGRGIRSHIWYVFRSVFYPYPIALCSQGGMSQFMEQPASNTCPQELNHRRITECRQQHPENSRDTRNECTQTWPLVGTLVRTRRHAWGALSRSWWWISRRRDIPLFLPDTKNGAIVRQRNKFPDSVCLQIHFSSLFLPSVWRLG